MLLSSLTDPNYEVRFSAVKASANYLLLNDKAWVCSNIIEYLNILSYISFMKTLWDFIKNAIFRTENYTPLVICTIIFVVQVCVF